METKQEYSIVKRQQITPNTWQMLRDIGSAFHHSQKAGIHSDAEGAIKALFCVELGLPIAPSMNGLYFYNGKLGIESSIVATLLRQHPNYDYKVKYLDNTGCTIEILRRNPETGTFEPEGEASFDESDAQRANLLDNKSKPGWKYYPTDQYFAKAILRAQRRFAPDVFGGPIYDREEIDSWDVLDAEIISQSPTVQVPPQSDIIKHFIPILKIDGLQATGVLNATTEKELAEAYIKVLDDTRQVLIDKFGKDAFVQAGGELSGQMDEEWLFEVADKLAQTPEGESELRTVQSDQ